MERIRAVINTPLGSKARLRMGVDQMSREGYQKNVSGIGPKDFNDINYIAGRASLVVDITPDLENYTIVSISIRTQTARSEGVRAALQTSSHPAVEALSFRSAP
jgi:hypothetical protein